MGYACPVCGEPQFDGVHLANHLGVTAALGREDHVDWLERHVPEWADCGPEALADRVVEHAPAVETPDHLDDDGGRPNLEAALATRTARRGRGAGAGAPADVLAEARTLTRRMDGEERATGERTEAAPERDDESDENDVDPSGGGKR